MDTLWFKDKYRIPSARLPGWDYSTAGVYYVTVCVHAHECAFGRIEDGRICRGPAGDVVAEEWQHTEVIRPNVELDEWIVMPNHVHGIIAIKPGNAAYNSRVETPRRGVSTDMFGARPEWKPGTLGAIVNQFKSMCTKRIRVIGYSDFKWQPRFHDRVIRDDMALENIRRYIQENPARWRKGEGGRECGTDHDL